MTMPILANPYRGINAHLHSLAQNPAEGSATIWTSIHAAHIGHIVDALNARLPLNYVARPEQSLQIWTEDEWGMPLNKRSPRPDAAIYPSGVPTSESGGAALAQAPVRVISISQYLEREITIPSAVIYEIVEHEIVGKPVTRIELLSASNKRGGVGHHGYMDNRWSAIFSGTSLIELDYLHQTVSPLPGVPPYPSEPDSHAYTLAVTDRRPQQDHEIMILYIVNVDQSLPAINLPLTDNDSLIFDFDTVYQHTFQTGRWGIHIDYSELPRSFERYSAEDQTYIRTVIERIKKETAKSE